jgi:hypothetical protein
MGTSVDHDNCSAYTLGGLGASSYLYFHAGCSVIRNLRLSITKRCSDFDDEVSNSGPHSLLLLFSKSINTKSLLVEGLVLLLATSTLLLQFTSTALLSEVRLGIIPITQLLPNISYGYSDQYFMETETLGIVGYSSTKPQYHAFAEFSEQPSIEDGVSDTGLSIRAFLPIGPEASRDLVKNYTGMATLFDTRTVCMRPEVSEIQVEALMYRLGSGPSLNLVGRVGTNMTAPRFNRTARADASTLNPFNCTYAIRPDSLNALSPSSYAKSHDWPLVLCGLEITDTGIISEMDPLNLHGIPTAFLLINTTDAFGDLASSADLNVSFQEPRGEWLILHTNDTQLSFSLTLCYQNIQTQDASIDAWRSTDGNIEATSRWDRITATFDTLAPRRQLGAIAPKETLTPSDRGIFTLRAKPSWDAMYGEVPTSTVPEQILNGVFASYPGSNRSMALCSYCTSSANINTNIEYAAVFQDILKDAQSPALAIQALITTLIGMSYYDYIVQFDVDAPGTIVSNTSVLKPTGRKPFILVLAVITTHLFLVALVTVIFAIGGKHSLIGNAWSVVAQLQSPEIVAWIAKADKMNDRAVEKIMKAAGSDGVLVGVGDVGCHMRLLRRGAGDVGDHIQLMGRQ